MTEKESEKLETNRFVSLHHNDINDHNLEWTLIKEKERLTIKKNLQMALTNNIGNFINKKNKMLFPSYEDPINQL